MGLHQVERLFFVYAHRICSDWTFASACLSEHSLLTNEINTKIAQASYCLCCKQQNTTKAPTTEMLCSFMCCCQVLYCRVLSSDEARNEHRTNSKQQNECAPSEDSDQLGHLLSLIRVFAVRSVGNYGYKLSSCGH